MALSWVAAVGYGARAVSAGGSTLTHRPAARWSTALVALAVILAFPSVAAAVGSTPTSLEIITSSMEPQPVGRTATLTVGVEPWETGNSGTGTVTFLRVDGPDEVELGTAPVVLSPYVTHLADASLDLPADLPVGTYTIIARYSGDATFAPSESSPIVQHVGPRPTETTVTLGTPLASPATSVPRGTDLYAWWLVRDIGYLANELPDDGTVKVKLDGVQIATGSWDSQTTIDTSALSLGTHTVNVEHGASTDFQASSASASIEVVANGVDASGFTIDHTTFYPVKDGYRDTVTLSGQRNEPIAVSLRVYDANGHLIRTLSVASHDGPYAVSWTGRSAAGTLQPAGTYKLVQRLTDGAGASLTVTKTVTLSHKQLITKTSYVTKDGDALGKRLTMGSGRITTSSTGYVKLSVPGGTSGLAAGAWTFTLPSAVRYTSIWFQVDAKAPLVAGPNGFGLHDFTICPHFTTDLDLSCYSPWTEVGTGARAWQTVRGSATNDVTGRTARGAVSMNYATAYVYHVRIKVTYQVLG